ncbi:MAG: cysteine--tRNA ligase [Bacillota bacterium]|nr:cysteine--tRNA ligase [Bacillota bacterium]
MSICLYDTLTRQKREFVSRRPGEVSVYVCGVTPYDYTHLGHARVSVLWDVFRRYFAYRGYRVKFVQNFTDVDDKIINRAIQEGRPAWKVAQRFIDDYHEGMARLGVAPADLHPRVSTEIDAIVDFIGVLIEKGHAYPAGGDVFYSVESFPGYGRLSGRSVEEMEAGARIEVNPLKRHPMDFALWKAAKPGEPAWESPWGPGRPGWHIECSAMSYKYLGAAFDIHGGGLDLVFPHHENEMAQSEAFTGQPLARFWVHNGMLNVAEEKMSKSLGNTFAVKDVLAAWDPRTVRYFLISAHYRSPLTYSRDELKAADQARRRLVQAVRVVDDLLRKDGGEQAATAAPQAAERLQAAAETARREFEAAMDDDLNTALALAALHSLASQVNREVNDRGFRLTGETLTALKEVREVFAGLDDVLRVLHGEAEETRHRFGADQTSGGDEARGEKSIDKVRVEELIARRQEARAAKDWTTADRIRDELKTLGIVLEDTPHGVRWKWEEPR